MSAVMEQPPVPSTEPAERRAGFGDLLRSELHRFRSRRFIQVVLVLGLLGWVVATAISLTQFATPSADELARAEQQAEQSVAENNRFREQCLAEPGELPPDLTAQDVCPPEMTREDVELSWFLNPAPFDFADAALVGVLGFAVISAVLAGLIGATWIGAEWSNRSLVALLFWVPQRMRVMAAKLVVLIGACLLLGIVAQASWLAMSRLLDAVAGTGEELPPDLWSDLLQTQARAVLLTVVAGLLAFGLTNLVRNTGAALGIAFVYLVIVENAVRALRPRWQPWLLSDNAAALVQDGGLTILIYDTTPDSTGVVQPTEYFLGHLQAGIFLAVVAAVVVAIGAVLFARRDVH
jgi:hypothetical protein